MREFRSNETYSAPECREPYTAAYGPRGVKSIDIWALGCMFLETIVFIRGGPIGIIRFQALREEPTSAAGITGQSDLFHNGLSLKPQISAWLRDATGPGTMGSPSTQKRSEIYQPLLEMFDIDPRIRATARDVANVLKDVDLASLLTSGTYPRAVASEIISKVFSWAATVTSKEPALAAGNRRVHWKCVCAGLLTSLTDSGQYLSGLRKNIP